LPICYSYVRTVQLCKDKCAGLADSSNPAAGLQAEHISTWCSIICTRLHLL